MGRDPLAGKYMQLISTVKGGLRIADQALVRLVVQAKTEGSIASIAVGRLLEQWINAPLNQSLAPQSRAYLTSLRTTYKPITSSIKL